MGSKTAALEWQNESSYLYDKKGHICKQDKEGHNCIYVWLVYKAIVVSIAL